MQTLKEQLDEIELLIRYAAPEAAREKALRFAVRHGEDRIALRLVHHFYSFLPEGLDDALVRLSLIKKKQGLFLMLAKSLLAEYLYLVNTEEAVFLGRPEEIALDEEMLLFFGWPDRDHFAKAAIAFTALPEYEATPHEEILCPACSVAAGEEHIMGCPVEICPWCGGQLTSCDCRFTQLGKDRLYCDSHIDELYEKARRKGRIPFEPEKQAPGYFSLSEHLKKK